MAMIMDRTNLHDSATVGLIADQVGIPVLHAVGCLHRAWSWVKEDGHTIVGTKDLGIRRATAAILDAKTVPGLAAAMVANGWLIVEDTGLIFPGTLPYIGIPERERDRDRMDESRRNAERSRVYRQERAQPQREPERTPSAHASADKALAERARKRSPLGASTAQHSTTPHVTTQQAAAEQAPERSPERPTPDAPVETVDAAAAERLREADALPADAAAADPPAGDNEAWGERSDALVRAGVDSRMAIDLAKTATTAQVASVLKRALAGAKGPGWIVQALRGTPKTDRMAELRKAIQGAKR